MSVESPSDEETLAAVAALWERYKAIIMSRLAVLDEARRALQQGTLQPDLRAQAREEAHKLAGSLGSFGFPEGSRLAKQAERLFKAEGPLGRPEAPRLTRLLGALHRSLDSPPSNSRQEAQPVEQIAASPD
jgi:HPt (histidine-containing phosphotransfer) domain-containing protein